jgi:hypothetical protein
MTNYHFSAKHLEKTVSTLLPPHQIECSDHNELQRWASRWLVAVIMASFSGTAMAQSLPTLVTPAKGDTINMSVQNGSKSSLSFGSSTSFGASVNMNTTEGTSTSATSMLAPKDGSTLTFSIGNGSQQGKTSANIDNLRAQGGGSTTVAGSPIEARDSTFSSGNALLEGVQSVVVVPLDADRTGFTAKTNTLHSTYSTGKEAGQDGPQLGSGSQSANASGSAMVNSNTNVDINSSSFTSVFLQAF